MQQILKVLLILIKVLGQYGYLKSSDLKKILGCSWSGLKILKYAKDLVDGLL